MSWSETIPSIDPMPLTLPEMIILYNHKYEQLVRQQLRAEGKERIILSEEGVKHLS